MKNKKTNKEVKKPLITTKKKTDNSVEVIIQKSPAKTLWGKIFIMILVFGMSLLLVVALILMIIQAFK